MEMKSDPPSVPNGPRITDHGPRSEAGGGVVTQHDLDVAVSLRRRARAAVAEARAHNATLTARLMTGYAVELGTLHPAVERVRFNGDKEASIIFAIFDSADEIPEPVVVDRFEPGQEPDQPEGGR